MAKSSSKKTHHLFPPGHQFLDSWEGYDPARRVKGSSRVKSVVQQPGIQLTDLKPLPIAMMNDLREDGGEVIRSASGRLTQRELSTLAEEYELFTGKWVFCLQLLDLDSFKASYR